MPGVAVCGAEVPRGVPADVRRPEPVGVAGRLDAFRSRTPRLVPARLARPREHRLGDEHRPGRPVHHLVRVRTETGEDELVDAVRDAGIAGQPGGDESDAELSEAVARVDRILVP